MFTFSSRYKVLHVRFSAVKNSFVKPAMMVSVDKSQVDSPLKRIELKTNDCKNIPIIYKLECKQLYELSRFGLQDSGFLCLFSFLIQHLEQKVGGLACGLEDFGNLANSSPKMTQNARISFSKLPSSPTD